VQILLAAVLVIVVAVVVLLPLLRGVDESRVDPLREELEIAKQAKYREIRDAEIDFRAGKLNEDEWRETDRELRREGTAILARMDRGDDARETAGDPLN
jgi:hypothetical protein